jgi:site-specific DNA-methyltransferase (adenine-specific)
VWCLRVPTGAFVAVRDGVAFPTGNSGFPKSQDVSKAIDKAAGAEREVVGVRQLTGYGKANVVNGQQQRFTTEFAETSKVPTTDAAKQWEGWGTALKPSCEPITVARKPLIGTVAANVLQYGTGAINIDGCRVPTDDNLNGGAYAKQGGRDISPSLRQGSGMNQPGKTTGEEYVQPVGRWPANMVHDGSEEVVALFPQSKAGAIVSGPRGTRPGGFGNVGAAKGSDTPNGPQYGDGGSAARFFYSPKANKADRGKDNAHPTVKPTDLMRYLCRLVTPPGGVVLDPFCGSGSTGKAALLEGFEFFGCEIDPAYVEIANRRLTEVV